MAHRSWSRAASVAALLAVSLTVVTARAADADELVAQGIELRREGRDAEALEVFRRAQAIAPTPRITAQLGLAEHALSKWLDAERDLSTALTRADDPWIAKNLEALRSALSAVEAHLGWLQITCDIPGAKLRVAGGSVGETPLSAPVRVVAEPVTVEAQKQGYAPVKLVVSIASKQHARVDLALTPSAPTPAAPKPVDALPPPRTALSPMIGMGLIGVSIAGVVVGTWFGVRALDAKKEQSAHCDPGCDTEGLTAHSELRVASTTSTIAFGAAAVTGVVGVLLALPVFGRGSVAPTVATQGLGLSWRGEF